MHTSFHDDKQHGFISSVENVILTNIMHTKDDTIDYAVSDTWCQMVWHLTDGAGPHSHPMLWDVGTRFAPHGPLPICGIVDQVQWATKVMAGTA